MMDSENNKQQQVVVGVRFSKIGKNYFFDASNLEGFNIGDFVVVETSRGWQIGELTQIVDNEQFKNNLNYKPINRKATSEDLAKRDDLAKNAEEALLYCRQEVKRLNIANVKIISSEISFDNKLISFIYTSATDEQPNLNPLKGSLTKYFKNIRVDFHKIGPRDVARYLGGMGACGFETRCCAKFLKDFESISINMAKKQGISLTPSDITGMCDRLRCCLQYEYCQYVDILGKFPRKNKIVETPKGKGKVVDIAPLSNTVSVYLEEIGVKDFSLEEIQEIVDHSVQESQKNIEKKDKQGRKPFRARNRKN